MPVLFLYILKLSISFSIVYLFYHFVLRRLTFYNSNRWYLIGYTLLSFLIPFINITPVLESNSFGHNDIVRMIPSVEKYTSSVPENETWSLLTTFADWNKWDWISFVLLAGAGIFLVRFIFRCISFFNMRRKADLLPVDGIKLYQVNEKITPFSFGNAVFFNSDLHTWDELREIIRHEFVHVKQKHTLDILWSEWLCIINWYNPFAWLLKASIRQNLEFIADNKVLQNGVDRKQYQYLLLKVIGNNHFSIAPKFNFSSLKKRIVMMNKLQSAKLHLVKFLFIVPLLAVILISFRQRKQEPVTATSIKENNLSQVADTIPGINVPNEKGYIIHIKRTNGNTTVVINDKSGKEVKQVSLSEWNKKEDYYENLYGELPPPPPPPAPPVPPLPPVAPKPVKLPTNVKSININNDNATVHLKNGTKENYDLSNPDQKAAFEKNYGPLPEPPLPPTPPDEPASPEEPKTRVALVTTDSYDNLARISNDFEITNKKAVMHLKNGETENYDLTNNDERWKFEKKYGKIINTNNNTTVRTSVKSSIHSNVNANIDTRLNSAVAVSPVAVVTTISEPAVIAPVKTSVSTSVNAVIVDPFGNSFTGDEDLAVTITRKTTADQLEEFKKQMKEKGIELTFDNVKFDSGKLISISGSMKSKDAHSIFSGSDFIKLKLGITKDGNRTYFKVSVTDSKTII